jgi:Uma2 family endonuclease
MVTLAYNYDPHRILPTAEDLPDSDDTPVDNELQDIAPHLLKQILNLAWSDLQDWFFGVDMGIYYNPDTRDPIIPDGFLALGVPKLTTERGRLSYVLWEENWVLPTLALEIVSQTYRSEYGDKLQAYEAIGILYYVIYNPLSGRRGAYKHRNSLEVYKLISGKYELMPPTLLSESSKGIVWIPEIELGIGCDRGTFGGWTREWMYWYNEQGKRYLSEEERAKKLEERASKLEERANKLEERLRSLGINPDEII